MQAIITKYHGPVGTKGARISAVCEGGKVCVPYDHGAKDPHYIAAQALIERMNWQHLLVRHTLVQGGMPDGTSRCFVFVERP